MTLVALITVLKFVTGKAWWIHLKFDKFDGWDGNSALARGSVDVD